VLRSRSAAGIEGSVPGIRETHRLTVTQVTAPLDPASLPFQRTDEIPPLEAVFGQERAVRAIEFALGMEAPGYNLFASGPDGIGKSTIVESFLRRRAAQMPAPQDWIYVRNFENPDRPLGIALLPGRGREFAESVSRTVAAAGREIRAAFDSDDYARQQQALGSSIEEERAQLLQKLQDDAKELGFFLQLTPQGISSAPLIDGKPATQEQFDALPAEQRAHFQEQAKRLEELVQDSMLRIRATERSARERAGKLDEEVAAAAIHDLFQTVIDEYGQDQELRSFLEAVRDDIRKERDRFRQEGQQQVVALPGLTMPQAAPPIRRYEVNVVISNNPSDGAPVIRERHPTFYNLLGRIEYQGQFGAAVTDHTMIKAGTLAQANGGFIVLRLRDLLGQPLALDALKRALATGELAIENVAETYGLVPTAGLRPEPIPLHVKVVVVGDSYLYSLLYRYDPDFRELFRVKADFEVDVPRTAENVRGLAGFIASHCEREALRCFTADAVSRLVESSSRTVEDQQRLSANLGAFLDLIRQANYWAQVDASEVVEARHVDRALEERVYRSALVRDRIQEAIDKGEIIVEVEGARSGQINALAVYDLGDFEFGRPSRITCVTSAGHGTIVMVDRESDMSGRIHTKGFLILRGFLTERFGQLRAGQLHASLTFEQLYGDIDGDSASSTEIYSLLSALADAPIDQGIAVTGSVDQHGRIQPIGGATAKIEGFFEACRQRGLNGKQGVMIPASNVQHVILRPEVARAVADGRFHVWSVSTIEEGIELLTGVPAGERGADGQYPEGTLYRRVEDRLAGFAEQLREQAMQPAQPGAHIVMPSAPAPNPPGIPPQPPPEPPVRV
jgi:predicted ATP-dependent protease